MTEPPYGPRDPAAVLHIIGTDALLWALGGFDDERQGNSRGPHCPYTTADIDLIRSFYRRFGGDGGLERGKAKALADLLGRDRVALRVSMYQMRRRGVLPPLRGAA